MITLFVSRTATNKVYRVLGRKGGGKKRTKTQGETSKGRVLYRRLLIFKRTRRQRRRWDVWSEFGQTLILSYSYAALLRHSAGRCCLLRLGLKNSITNSYF